LLTHLWISTAELIVTIKPRSAGSSRGTWVHPEIALHLIQWLGLDFWAWSTLAEELFPTPLTEQLPKTFFEALKALAATEYYLVRMENTFSMAEDCLNEKEEQLEAQQPMIDYYNRAMNSDGSFPMEEVAKILGYSQLGRNNLFLFLRYMGVLNLNNLPYQKYIDAGYFKCAAVPCPKRKGRTQTFVTQKGMAYIHRLIQENDYRRCLHEWGYFQSWLEDELEDDLDAA
jgi:phage antirepressor YoqD-like protein